jgi:hypothetical protein
MRRIQVRARLPQPGRVRPMKCMAERIGGTTDEPYET